MSLADTQAELARLFTQAAARTEFLADPTAAPLLEGAGSQDRSALAAEIERYARGLIAKRRLDVEKWLPLTAKALGRGFGERLRETLTEPPPGARADALALVARLRLAPEPPWLGELASYESEFLRAWGPRAHVAIRLYRWPVPRIADRLAAGATTPHVAPATTLALWARPPNGRLRHMWWMFGRSA